MHRIKKSGITLFAVSLSLLTSSFPAGAQTDSPKTDNSKVNKRDRAKGGKTADDQKNDKPDIQISADIRKSIVADKSLSTYAHNVKIVTRGGMVTLKGPVRSEDEKGSVEAKANEVAGADKVTSQITVVPAKKGKTTKSATN
jgi:hyperosmotically inducible protein